MNRAQLEAAADLGCRIQIWHLTAAAASSADGQWDTCEGRPKFECPIHLYRVHPDDLHLLRAGHKHRASAYFSADPAEGEFRIHDTLEAAREDAEGLLESAGDEAADWGWADDPPQICYGELIGHCVEEQRMPAPDDSDFDYYVTFGLHPISTRDRTPGYTHEDVMRLVEALDNIGGLSRALRQGGPAPEDLHGLSNALETAIDTANDAIINSQGNACEPRIGAVPAVPNEDSGHQHLKALGVMVYEVDFGEGDKGLYVRLRDFNSVCDTLARPATATQAVDLEQFREAVELWKLEAEIAGMGLEVPDERIAEANRLLALIDAQHEKESAPDALVRIASELERIDGHPISGIGRSLADSLRGRAYILRAYDAQSAKGDGDA